MKFNKTIYIRQTSRIPSIGQKQNQLILTFNYQLLDFKKSTYQCIFYIETYLKVEKLSKPVISTFFKQKSLRKQFRPTFEIDSKHINREGYAGL